MQRFQLVRCVSSGVRVATALCLSVVIAFANGAEPARSKALNVVATIPDLADMAREIGGSRVSVKSLCKGTENVHSVPQRPSSLVAVGRADVLIEMGLSLEHAFLPGLLDAARNSKLRPGSPNLVNVSIGWEAINVPSDASRVQGTDLHLDGNPHFNLSPAGGRHIANAIAEGLIVIDPEGEDTYREQLAAYLKRIDAAELRWNKMSAELLGKRLVTYHTDFDYLLLARGIERVATVEEKPGLPPSPGYLVSLVETMREKDVSVILTAKWSNAKQVRFVADKCGASIIELPAMVGGSKRATTWIAMMDEIHEALVAALLPQTE